jgi:hypothetical protein
MRLRPARALVAIAVCVACISAATSADTIVLKNGRRIVADHVTQTDGKVTYQTPSGEMSIPQSIVDHIDKDDLSYTSAAQAASQAKIAPVNTQPVAPTIDGYNELASQTVHADGVDFAFIARLDQDARSGSSDALNKDAAAHHIAAQYLVGKGDAASAISQYKQALVVSP